MDMKHKAKAEMLKTLSKMMADDQHEPVKEVLGKKLNKVTVMADSKQGLQKGLSTAEQLLAKRNAEKGLEKEEPEMQEASESPEMESEEDANIADEDMSEEDIMAMMDVLKAKMEAKKANC